MILLSNVFKPSAVSHVQNKKVLLADPIHNEVQMQTTEENEDLESEKAKDEANQWLENAREEADRIREEARREADEERAREEEKRQQWWEQQQREAETLKERSETEGYEAGYRAGEEEALKKTEEQCRERVEEAGRVLTQAHEEKDKLIAEAEPFLVDLSVSIAEKILQNEIREHPEATLEMVQQQLKRVKERSRIEIDVDPEHYEVVATQREKLSQYVDGQPELLIYPDHSITSGGCVVRTPYGSMDARVDQQLQEIKETLLNYAQDDAK